MISLTGKKVHSHELSKLSVNLTKELFDDMFFQIQNKKHER